MTLDLLDKDGNARVLLSLFLQGLCMEAGVCIHREFVGNTILIKKATWDDVDGLVVTDENGTACRLRVRAERCPNV